MISVRSLAKFEFYAELYPIIRHDGWEIGMMGMGRVNFLCHMPFTTHLARHDFDYRGCMVGIVVGANWWHYCWKAITYGHMYGNRLDVPNDLSPCLVYDVVKLNALEYLAKLDAEYEAEFNSFKVDYENRNR